MFKLQMRTMDLFLLLALILTGAPRAADGHESVTVKVREGHDAILPCSISTNMESESFDWRNKDKEVFFYEKGAPSGNERDGQHKDFKHRVFHFQDELKDGNASIRITNTKMADSGDYSCYLPNQDKWCHVQLVVESVTVKVREGHDAILPCSISTNMESESFDWRNKDKEVFFYEKGAPSGNERDGQHKDFKHRVFHFQDELKDGNASIRITNTKMADSGDYSCYLPNQDKWCHVQLVVGVCPTPLFSPLSQTKTWTLLQCEVHGVSPDLQVELKDSSGTVLHAKRTLEPKGGGTYDMVLQTNVTKSGVYSCVVTQEDICHQISSNTSVYVHDSTTSNVAIGVTVGLICTILGLLVGFVTGVFRKRCCKGPSKDSSYHAADESASMNPP